MGVLSRLSVCESSNDFGRVVLIRKLDQSVSDLRIRAFSRGFKKRRSEIFRTINGVVIHGGNNGCSFFIIQPVDGHRTYPRM